MRSDPLNETAVLSEEQDEDTHVYLVQAYEATHRQLESIAHAVFVAQERVGGRDECICKFKEWILIDFQSTTGRECSMPYKFSELVPDRIV